MAVFATAVVLLERARRERARAAAEAAAWAEFRRTSPALARLTEGFRQLRPVVAQATAAMNDLGATLMKDPYFRAYAEAHRDDEDDEDVPR
jgi:hypothetical protein